MLSSSIPGFTKTARFSRNFTNSEYIVGQTVTPSRAQDEKSRDWRSFFRFRFESGRNILIMLLDFVFKSSDHLRYENGAHVSGPHGGAGRAVVVEPNINGVEGYSVVPGDGLVVSIYNLDGPHPTWRDNLQMTHKPMRVIGQTDSQVRLRGFQTQAMSPFGWVDFDGADYGLTIDLDLMGNAIQCTLHMFDRKVDIVYIA